MRQPLKQLLFFSIYVSIKVMATPSLFYLPQTLAIQNHTFHLEHAVTPKERQLGLMHRESLSSNNAMLFAYQDPQSISVWMKNTLIPLDLIWLDDEFHILAIEYGTPLSTQIHTPQVLATYLLEIKGNLSNDLMIKPGDQFTSK